MRIHKRNVFQFNPKQMVCFYFINIMKHVNDFVPFFDIIMGVPQKQIFFTPIAVQDNMAYTFVHSPCP